MITFLKGDTTAEITLALAGGYDYSGKTIHLEYQGARRTFTGCVAGGALSFSFTAEETAPMSLGAYPVRAWIEGGGEVLTVHNADVKLCVTDCIVDVHGGGAICLDVRGGLYGIEGLPEKFTDEDVRRKLHEILRRGGGTVAALLLCFTAAYGATLDVQTARKGSIYNDCQIVTNVELDVHALTNGWKFGSDVDLTAATNYTDSALGAFASTGAVFRASSYGTPTRWTDATGCVWEVAGWRVYTNGVVAAGWTAWSRFADSGPDGVFYNLVVGLDETEGGPSIASAVLPEGVAPNWGNEYEAIYNYDYDFYGLTRGDTIRAARDETNLVGRVAYTNDIPDMDDYATKDDATNAAVAVADAKISTNNPAFVAAVLAAPLAGASASDIAEIAEYGGYGTVGAALLALIAGLAALKRRVGAAETAVAGKADAADLRYKIATPGFTAWTFSGVPSGWTAGVEERQEGVYLFITDGGEGYYENYYIPGTYTRLVAELGGNVVTATRSYLLLDRASNRVTPTGSSALTLTLTPAVPGYMRDLIVRLDLTALATAPEVTFAAPTGGTVTFETEDGAMPELVAGKVNLVSLTETAAGVFAVAHKTMQEVE